MAHESNIRPMGAAEWVIWVALRMGTKLNEYQIAMYTEEIESWGFTEAELFALERVIRRQCDKFPGPSTMRALGHGIRFNKGQTEPVFVTKRDAEGRVWAKPTRKRKSTIPSEHEIEQWKEEMAPPGFAETAYKHAFHLAGINPAESSKNSSKHPHEIDKVNASEIVRISLGKDLPPGKEYADYDDSDEALGIKPAEKPKELPGVSESADPDDDDW